MKVALDAMSGDFAPFSTIKGAIEALEEKAADLKKEISEDKNIKEIKTKAQKKVKKVVNEIKNSTSKQN